MREVASNIAYRAVRNRGTVGGSLVHADPAADWPSTLMLLGATALIAGPGGRREISMEKFFTGLFETVLTPEELLVAVRIPRRSKAARFGYWKFCRKAGEFPQAIGGALSDPERRETRAVVGATEGAPRLFLDLNPEIAGIGKDAYARQLHAVALKRAVAKVLS
jgi:carbon-monoxide dehydrogenase medium subunit